MMVEVTWGREGGTDRVNAGAMGAQVRAVVQLPAATWSKGSVLPFRKPTWIIMQQLLVSETLCKPQESQ